MKLGRSPVNWIAWSNNRGIASEVLDTAHRAGMAEIASDVLHNVGNAMNSINCAIEFLDERLRGRKYRTWTAHETPA